MFVLKLFKFELVNEESQKEVVNLLGDQVVVNFLFPNLKGKLLSLPCFSSNQIQRDTISPTTDTVADPGKSPEIFLKIFNTEEFVQTKQKADLRCQELLQEMHRTVMTDKAKALEKLTAAKSRVKENMRDYEDKLKAEKTQILTETVNENSNIIKKNKKRLELYNGFLQTPITF